MDDIRHLQREEKDGKNPAFLLLPLYPLGSLSDLKEIGCKSVWAVSYFTIFSSNKITIGLQNPQNQPSPSHFFAAIFKSDKH
jgi:hypothetical protein